MVSHMRPRQRIPYTLQVMYRNFGTFHERPKVVDSLSGYTSDIAACRRNLAPRAKLSMRLSFQHERLGRFRVRLSRIVV